MEDRSIAKPRRILYIIKNIGSVYNSNDSITIESISVHIIEVSVERQDFYIVGLVVLSDIRETICNETFRFIKLLRRSSSYLFSGIQHLVQDIFITGVFKRHLGYFTKSKDRPDNLWGLSKRGGKRIESNVVRRNTDNLWAGVLRDKLTISFILVVVFPLYRSKTITILNPIVQEFTCSIDKVRLSQLVIHIGLDNFSLLLVVGVLI